MKVQGTGKSHQMGAEYFAELPDEVAEGLISKGFVAEVDEIPAEPVEEKKPIKPMTVADNIITKNETEEPVKNEKAEKV